MQTVEVDMLAFLDDVDELVEFVLRNTELILVETCCHIFVSVSINVRIYTNGNIGFKTIHVSHLIDHIYLLERLAVECLDSQTKGIEYFLVGLSNSRVDNLVGRKSAAVSMQDFISADAVGTESLGAYIFQKSSFYVCLHCIMNLDVVFFSKHCNVIYSLAEQFHIIVIERCRNPVKFLYCIYIKHLYPKSKKRLQK